MVLTFCVELVGCVDVVCTKYLVDQDGLIIVLKSILVIDLLRVFGREQVESNKKNRDDKTKLNAGCSSCFSNFGYALVSRYLG